MRPLVPVVRVTGAGMERQIHDNREHDQSLGHGSALLLLVPGWSRRSPARPERSAPYMVTTASPLWHTYV